MAARMVSGTPLTPTSALSLLDRGERPEEAALVRLLRSPGCPAALVERLAGCRWVLRERRVLPLVIRHPACPRPFAMEGAARLGWRDLLDVARYPRAAPSIRRQAERKVLDLVPQLTLGERVALARVATRAVIPGLLDSADVRCVQALLDSPQFTESDAIRLLRCNERAECALAVVRHPRWGMVPQVVRAALRHRNLPIGIALGLLVRLGSAELGELASSPDVPPSVRAASERLVQWRRAANDTT